MRNHEQHNYDQLRQSVDKGETELTYVISPMRTLSTVILPWASPLTDEWTSEPLHPFGCKDFNDGCGHILDKVNTVRVSRNGSNKSPIRIMAKDMAHIVTPEIFGQLLPVTKNFVFTMREPYLQAASSIRQFCKDMEKGPGGVPDAPGRQQQAEAQYRTYNAPAYRNMEAYIRQLTSGTLTKNVALVEAFGLKMAPDKTLQLLGEKLQRPAPAHPAKPWTALSRDRFVSTRGKSPEELAQVSVSHWNEKVVASTRIEPISDVDDKPPPPSFFSPETLQFIRNVALPAYMRFLMNPAIIGLPTLAQLDNARPCGQKLEDINPVGAYALALAASARTSPRVENAKPDGIMQRIEQANPQYREDFSILRQVAARQDINPRFQLHNGR